MSRSGIGCSAARWERRPITTDHAALSAEGFAILAGAGANASQRRAASRRDSRSRNSGRQVAKAYPCRRADVAPSRPAPSRRNRPCPSCPERRVMFPGRKSDPRAGDFSALSDRAEAKSFDDVKARHCVIGMLRHALDGHISRANAGEKAIDQALPIDGASMFSRARRLLYRFGITPGALSGQLAIVLSSTLRCCATSLGGVCASQLESETSS